MWAHRTNHCLPNWRDRQVSTETHHVTKAETHEQKPLWEPLIKVGTPRLYFMNIGNSVLTSLSVTNSRGPVVRWLRHFCEFYLQGLYTVLTAKIRGKYPPASTGGRGDVTIFETPVPEHWFFLARSGRGETISPEPNLPGFYQSPASLGKRKYPT